MKGSQKGLYLIGIVVAIAVFIVLKNKGLRDVDVPDRPRQEERDRQREKDRKQENDRRPENNQDREKRPPSDEPGRETGFDRRAGNGKLILTKHARCRMGCRHIDESEIREILEKGTINERKSEPAARPDPKYALEGRTHDGQQVRIIFAPTDRGMVVVTVIDLDTDWSCDCK